VAIVAAGDAKFGTGTLKGGNEIFVRCPTEELAIAALATQAVLIDVIRVALGAVLRNTRTVEAVVEASFAKIDSESMIAPSLLLQSTSIVQPAPLTVVKLVAEVNAAEPPIVANECSGRSTRRGALLVLVELMVIFGGEAHFAPFLQSF